MTSARTAGFRLLVVEPDSRAAARLADALTEHLVTATVCPDGAQALYLAGREQPDAVLTAAGLPAVGGVDVARVLSTRTAIPVLVGIGTDDGPAAAAALAAGATACVAYPYRLRELLAILRAIRADTPARSDPPLECGGLRLDPASMQVRLYGRVVPMPLQELRLLQLLMANPGRVVRRADIQGAIWDSEPSSNTITVHIRRLRQRLGDRPLDPKMILTVRGLGYRLDPPPPLAEPAAPAQTALATTEPARAEPVASAS